jgi:UDP-N-acetylmuramoyl-L-alanine---L-glutamate ligase
MVGMRWSDLAGRTVGVWGTGVEGRATLRRLEAEGVRPAVVVDSGWSAELLSCDLVVKSPGISRYGYEARRVIGAGIDLVGGLGLWLSEAAAGGWSGRVACVTGTKGKSTTTSIAGHLARGLGQRVFIGGNLGTPPWDPEAPADPSTADWFLIETSSYQATDVVDGPRVVAVTSLSQDHLQWHGDYPTYLGDKLSLATRPGVEVVLAPAGDAELEAHRGLLGPRVRTVAPAHPAWVAQLRLLGEHNVRNAVLAREILVALGVPKADDDAAVAAASDGFTPLRSRLTRVATLAGVDFVDDSLSTNVLPTLAAVEAFPGRRVAVLVGGQDRGIDYADLGPGLLGHGAGVKVFTLPDSGRHIAEVLASTAPGLAVEVCADLAEAVPAAYAWARPGGVVLLSPAAPSFGRYRDYAERAAHFETCVAALA